MFNSQKPSDNDLPTTSQLIKSTLIAFGIASVLLVTAILPAEYGYDPTGVGELLGLKKMGDIKTSLIMEQMNDSQSIDNDNPAKNSNALVEENIDGKQDVSEVIIEPGDAIELKLEMKKGSIAQYDWTTLNGSLNFNLHGDGYKGTHKSTTYKKGRMTSSDSGELVAEFDGYHGWFWRNRNKVAVTLILKTTGDYIKLKRML
jgi:hypothetical protein